MNMTDTISPTNPLAQLEHLNEQQLRCLLVKMLTAAISTSA